MTASAPHGPTQPASNDPYADPYDPVHQQNPVGHPAQPGPQGQQVQPGEHAQPGQLRQPTQSLTPEQLQQRRFRAVSSLGTWMLRVSVTTTAVTVAATVLGVLFLVVWVVVMANTVPASGEDPGPAFLLVILFPLLSSIVSMIGSLLLFVAWLAFTVLGVIAAVRARGSGRVGALIAVLPIVLNAVGGVLFYVVMIVGSAVMPDSGEEALGLLGTGLGIGILLVYLVAPVVSTIAAIVGSVMVRNWGRRSLEASTSALS